MHILACIGLRIQCGQVPGRSGNRCDRCLGEGFGNMKRPRKLDIVFTTMNDLSTFGGIETQIPQEVSYLKNCGFRIHLISRPPAGEMRVDMKALDSSQHYRRGLLVLPWILKDTIVALWIATRVRHLARQRELVAISFGVVDGTGVALAKLSGARVKLIQRIPGPLSYEAVHFTPKKLARYRFYALYFRLFEFFSYMIADAVLPVSEFEEANVRSYGITGSKVEVLRCGINHHKFNCRRSQSTLAPSGNMTVIFVGRLYEKNGPLVLAKSIPLVLAKKPKTTFVFVGDGPLRKTLETCLSPYVQSGQVVLAGFREDVANLLNEADVYVSHVSSKMDGIGQTAMEAMMCGLPVVVGRDHITQKLIADGVSGILVQKDNPDMLAEAIIALLQDEALRSRIGLAAREYAVSNLSFESMMKRLVKRIESLHACPSCSERE